MPGQRDMTTKDGHKADNDPKKIRARRYRTTTTGKEVESTILKRKKEKKTLSVGSFF